MVFIIGIYHTLSLIFQGLLNLADWLIHYVADVFEVNARDLGSAILVLLFCIVASAVTLTIIVIKLKYL